jgi:hypothetical protein
LVADVALQFALELRDDWQARAEDALEKARKMKLGPERFDAMKKAGQLRVAADLERALKARKD